jgi:uncharacterized protein
MNAELAPVKPKNRIEQIDILRGFALFGVLIVNVFGYNSSFFDFSGFYSQFEDPVNSTVFKLVVNYGSDKFIGLFSLLFGVGFAMMYTKYKDQESLFSKLYFRRLIILLGFGILHILLFWAGDILLSYGLLGMVLLFTRRINMRLLLILSPFFYFLPVLYIAINVIIPALPDALSSTCNISLDVVKETYSNGSIVDIFKLRILEYSSFRNINLIYYFPKVLGLFFAGYLFHKHQILEKINHKRNQFMVIGILLLTIGILLNTYTMEIVSSVVDANTNPYFTALYMGVFEVANIFLISSYLIIILVGSKSPIFAKILTPLKYVGRMSLTNYLTYTIVFTTIMYSYGFGYFGSLTPVELVISAFIFFSIQVIYCRAYLKHFQYGPTEWLWRGLMYRRIKA